MLEQHIQERNEPFEALVRFLLHITVVCNHTGKVLKYTERGFIDVGTLSRTLVHIYGLPYRYFVYILALGNSLSITEKIPILTKLLS